MYSIASPRVALRPRGGVSEGGRRIPDVPTFPVETGSGAHPDCKSGALRGVAGSTPASTTTPL